MLEVSRCAYKGCPSLSCVRRELYEKDKGDKSKPLLVLEKYKPEGHCAFYLGDPLWKVVEENNFPYSTYHKTVTV